MFFMIVGAKIIVIKDIVLHDYSCKKHLKYDMSYSTMYACNHGLGFWCCVKPCSRRKSFKHSK